MNAKYRLKYWRHDSRRQNVSNTARCTRSVLANYWQIYRYYLDFPDACDLEYDEQGGHY